MLYAPYSKPWERIKNKLMKNKSNSWDIISWIFGIVFFIIGVLNIIFVHIVPGSFYILFTFLYIPSTNIYFKNRFGFSIPIAVKIILGLIILWATLGVGDLMEMFESWVLS
jgi:hypothetical protein